jgi:hypothetical protein
VGDSGAAGTTSDTHGTDTDTKRTNDGNKGTEMELSVRIMAIRALIMYRTRELTELALFNNAFGSIGRRQLLAAARQCPQLDLALEPV